MSDYLTPEQVCHLLPGMTIGRLAALRYRGTGPRYRKPTARTVLYTRAEVVDWVEASSRRSTANSGS